MRIDGHLSSKPPYVFENSIEVSEGLYNMKSLTGTLVAFNFEDWFICVSGLWLRSFWDKLYV